MLNQDIERRSGLSYDEFRENYLLPRRPVIITDAVDGCPARARWTPDYFRDMVGHRVVETDEGPMRMVDFVDAIVSAEKGKAPFLRERPFPWLFPELIGDLAPFPVYAKPNWLEFPFARWADPFRCGFAARLVRLAQMDVNITGAGRRFPLLHLDLFECHALIMQWYGRKEFFVLGPEQTRYLYPNAEGDVSAIKNVEKPDLVTYPEFAKAKMLRATLMPGEVLFNPSGWWHTTRTLDVSIATVTSFGNASNWSHMVGRMRPKRLFGRVKFVPFEIYLRWLGHFRLPEFNPSDPTNVASSLRSYERCRDLAGPHFATPEVVESLRPGYKT